MPIWRSGAAVVASRVAQLERGGRGARGVVLVGVRRAEHGVQVRALVAERQVQQVAAVGRRGSAARWRTKSSSFALGVVVVVVVDAAEAHEQRVRRAQLGQELAASGAQALVDRRQQPWPERSRSGSRDPSPAAARSTSSIRICSTTADCRRRSPSSRRSRDPHALAQRIERRPLEHHLALGGEALGGRQRRRSAARRARRCSWTSGSPTTKRRAGPDGDGGLHRERARSSRPGVDDLAARASIVCCMASAARGGARAVVAVDPAGDARRR